MIAYGFQGGPHMLLDALILAAALLFVFGLGWYTGRHTNPGALLGDRTYVRNTRGSNKAGPEAAETTWVPNRNTPNVSEGDNG